MEPLLASKKSSKPDPTPTALQTEPYSLGAPDFATPRLATTDFPEFIAVMLEAVWHFKIDAKTNRYPKAEELVAYFITRRLSDGRLISPRQARALATFCRPVGAMKGGNSKPGEG
jgi:hypothetical protein